MDGPLSKRLQSVMDRFDVSIAVLGDYMLDEYIFGSVHRISPESPVPVVEFESESAVLGGAGNVISNIRALGGKPVPFGFVGNDLPGRKVLEIMSGDLASGTEHMVVDPSRPTTVKRRVIAQHQQLLRIDHESREPAARSVQDHVIESLQRAAPRLQAIVVSDYNKGAVTRLFFDRVLQVALEAGLPIVLDPKVFDLTDVGPVTVIKPNEKEAERLSGHPITGDGGLEIAGQRLLERTGARHVLITRGEHGMSLFTAGAPPLHVPTEARDVYDVTGAGDTVVGVLALSLAAGAALPEATQLANLAAGVVVGKIGTATVSRGELESVLGGNWPRAKSWGR